FHLPFETQPMVLQELFPARLLSTHKAKSLPLRIDGETAWSVRAMLGVDCPAPYPKHSFRSRIAWDRPAQVRIPVFCAVALPPSMFSSFTAIRSHRLESLHPIQYPLRILVIRLRQHLFWQEDAINHPEPLAVMAAGAVEVFIVRFQES